MTHRACNRAHAVLRMCAPHMEWTIHMLLLMRTTFDLPDDLVAEALAVSRLPTKRDAVIEGLKELIRRERRAELRRSAGTMKLNIDVARSRKRRE